MVSERISLDGDWQFRTDIDDVGIDMRWYDESARPDDRWETLPVPGFWEQQGNDGYEGIGWCRRDFELPRREGPLPQGLCLAEGPLPQGLCLAGIDDTARVWINGSEIASVGACAQRFAGKIDGVARPGRSTIVIRVPDRGIPGGILLGAWIGPFGDVDGLQRGEYASTPARPSADWVRDAVIYQAYLRSFSPEGTFQGLEQRLDELHSLGTSVLWLMPIHPIGKARRKGKLGSPYAVADYYAVNPELGTLDDFSSLLAAVQGRGMRLITDLVINHTAWDNPLVRSHPDWFARDKRGRMYSPLDDWTDVAQLDYRVPELRRYMTEMMLYWVREIGVDGFRCDVAGMVPTDFWEQARAELDAVRPVMMLAEDDRPEQHRRAFDLTYDWRTYQALGRLRTLRLKAASIATILANDRLDFPARSLRLRFSSNHDLCAWHKPGMERYGPEAAGAAAVLTFALPGVPLIYNGQEVANRRRLSLFERTPIDWNADDLGMKALFGKLTSLRRGRCSLRRGDVRLLDGLAETGVIGLCRAAAGETTCVLINCAPQTRRVELGQPPHSTWTTLLSNAPGPRPEHSPGIDLPPLGYWIGAAR
jgi:glycosidase